MIFLNVWKKRFGQVRNNLLKNNRNSNLKGLLFFLVNGKRKFVSLTGGLYLVDFIFSVVSLITGNYKCFISKVEDNIFELEFSCEAEECGEYYKILLNEEVEINFE